MIVVPADALGKSASISICSRYAELLYMGDWYTIVSIIVYQTAVKLIKYYCINVVLLRYSCIYNLVFTLLDYP